jgi:zinc/manganese transport system ATP-binding protein
MNPRSDAGLAGEILRVEGLTVRLGGRRILDEVSVRVAPGEFTGLIGSNGAGKTTLLKVILGLVAPTSGRVLVDGRPRSRRNSLIGYVPQKIELDPDMPLRARDLIGLGLDGHRYGLPVRSAERNARIEEMLAAVDATAFADARVGNLSGGEQQRVMIAHALISRPKLLLLDEPLANLDPAATELVAPLIGRDAGVTRVLTSHDPQAALAEADLVLGLDAGREAFLTTPDKVEPAAVQRLYA